MGVDSQNEVSKAIAKMFVLQFPDYSIPSHTPVERLPRLFVNVYLEVYLL